MQCSWCPFKILCSALTHKISWRAIFGQMYKLRSQSVLLKAASHSQCFTAPDSAVFLLYNNVYGAVLHYTLAGPYHDGCDMSGMRLWGWSGRHGMWQKHSLTISSWWVNQVFIHSQGASRAPLALLTSINSRPPLIEDIWAIHHLLWPIPYSYFLLIYFLFLFFISYILSYFNFP